jgi:hypothetical protein
MTRPFTDAEIRAAAERLGIPPEKAVAAARAGALQPVAPPGEGGSRPPRPIRPEMRQSVDRTLPEPITLALPLPLNRAQLRGFTITRYREDVRLFDAADRRPNPAPPPVPWGRVALTWHVEHGGTRLQDWDNLHARLKPLQDWLVRRGYLRDDSPAVIPACPTITQRAGVKPLLRRVLVTITPLPEAAA